MRAPAPERIAWLRVAVGLVMVAAPKQVLRMATTDVSGSMLLLTRTIGIRDLVIGLGTLRALRSDNVADGRRWMGASLASDVLDTIAGVTSAPMVGRGSAVLATAMAAPLAACDVWALASFTGRAEGDATAG
jgi:hypothetical protein